MTILVLNSGSSSIKFAVYERGGAAAHEPRERLRGQAAGLADSPTLSWRRDTGERFERALPRQATPDAALRAVLQLLMNEGGLEGVSGVGHRIAHGGQALTAPCRIDERALALIESLAPLAPLHQRHGLAGVRAMTALAPDVPQVACFDTSFHATQPPLHSTMPLPEDWRLRGARRYGFHGLSFESIAAQLPALLGPLADGRVIVAHLGSGASICGMRQRRSVRTSMALTTLDGLVMSTRPGSVDIGVALFVQQELHVDVAELGRKLHEESGLLALSGLSGDMRVLVESDDPRARFAIEMFCQRAAQEIAATAVAIGGCDAIVFTAGIGEHNDVARAGIVDLLGWMGARMDPASNHAHGPRLHADDSTIGIWVVPTDEEIVIARHTAAIVEAGTAAS